MMFATRYLPESAPHGAVSKAAGNHLLAILNQEDAFQIFRRIDILPIKKITYYIILSIRYIARQQEIIC